MNKLGTTENARGTSYSLLNTAAKKKMETLGGVRPKQDTREPAPFRSPRATYDVGL
jgi:hypothetical protein